MIRTVAGFFKRNSFWAGYFPGIIGVSFSGLVFSQIFLIDPEWPSYYFLTTTNFLLLALCYISFYQSIFIKNNLPDFLPPPRLKHQLRHNHPLYTQIKKQQKEGDRYKPPRTSRCRIDGLTVRFDHHCPYINNCVGLKNLKAFILFNAYGGTFALQFFVLSIYKYLQMLQLAVNPLTENQITCWLILTACSFVLTLAMLGLAITNLLTISVNITQIDMMKGTFQWRDKQGLYPNPFNLGPLTNFATIFQGELWTFWWPSAVVPRCDGTKFPMIPPITDQDKKTLYQDVQEMLKDPIQKSIPKTIEELYERQKENYKNTIFFFLGQQFKFEEQPQVQKEFKIEKINKIAEAEVHSQKQDLLKENQFLLAKNVEISKEQVQKIEQQQNNSQNIQKQQLTQLKVNFNSSEVTNTINEVQILQKVDVEAQEKKEEF